MKRRFYGRSQNQEMGFSKIKKKSQFTARASELGRGWK